MNVFPVSGSLSRKENQILSEDAAHRDHQYIASDRIKGIRRKKNDLFYERAVAANRDVQVRILLEFVEAMRDAANGSSMKEVTDNGGSCHDCDDFFRRTRYYIPEGILDARGHLTAFSHSLVIRYLKRVEVSEDEVVVQFKAGIEEHIKRGSDASPNEHI